MPVDLPPPEVAAVVVTAARLPPLRGEAAFSVVRIDQADLAAAVRVDEALGRTPGVSLFRRTSSLSANPTTQGISLRAIAPSGAGRTLVLLDGAPLLIPGEDSAMRAPLLRWLGGQNISPRLVGEFDDGALMKSFGQGGAGIFPAPTVIAAEVATTVGSVRLAATQRGALSR